MLGRKKERQIRLTHKAGAVLTECGLHIGGFGESVNETHLAVEQRAGLHKVVDHLLPADLPVSVRGDEGQTESPSSSSCRQSQHSLVLVQFPKLAQVGKVVPDRFEFIPGDVPITVGVEVLEDRLQAKKICQTAHRTLFAVCLPKTSL